MSSTKGRVLLYSLATSLMLSGCNGTVLPKFLSDAPEECTFTIGKEKFSLKGFDKKLSEVTGLNCHDIELKNLAEIDKLTNLTTLELVNTRLTQVNEIQPLTLLTQVNLSQNALLSLEGIADHPALLKLDLSNNALASVEDIPNILSLEQLNLAHNQLAEDITNLAALTNLTMLQLNSNPDIDCADITTLENVLETTDNPSILIPPSHCAVTLTLDKDSAESLDNSLQTIPFDLLLVSGEFTANDLKLIRSNDDLRIELLNTSGYITFENWFADTTSQIVLFKFSNGSEFSYPELRNLVTLHITLTNQEDSYTGSPYSDTIYGVNGNDEIFGNDGPDTLIGGSGADTLIGGAGDGDLLVGGTRVSENNYNNNAHSDTYRFNLNDGQDTLVDYSSSTSSKGHLVFGPGISSDNISLERSGDDLIFVVNNYNSIAVFNWYGSTYYRLATIQFDGNTPQSAVDFLATKQVSGTPDNDTFEGTNDIDVLNGMAGDDVIDGNSGNDQIFGGSGQDVLMGNIGADTLNGGAGDGDLLIGGSQVSENNYNNNAHSDTYLFNLNDGQDTLVDYSSSTSSKGHLIFGSGISNDNISLERVGDDLTFMVNDNDSITVFNWYGSAYYRLDTVQFDGSAAQSASDFVSNLSF